MKKEQQWLRFNIIRQSPIAIVKTFVALQLAGIALFFLASLLTHYAKIYRALSFSKIISFQIAEAIFLFSAETLLVFYIFFQWYKEYLEIKKDQIVHHRGIIFRKKVAIPLSAISAVTFRQGPLGRLTKYGTLELKENSAGKTFSFPYLPDPQKLTDLIVQLKNRPNNFSSETSSIPPSKKVPELPALLEKGEHEQLEFKTSLRWDPYRRQVNKSLEKAAIKTVAAFLNSQGGYLILGVSDQKEVVGLQDDFRSLPKADADGFENHFNNVFHQMIGPEHRPRVKLHHREYQQKPICLIQVLASPRPVYVSSGEEEEFFIRTGNNTSSLRLSQANSYIQSHFK